MAVWWHHGTEPSEAVSQRLFDALGTAADGRFGAGSWELDTNMRQIPSHFHAHARDKDWWDRRFSRAISRYSGVGGDRVTADGGPALD